MANEHPKREENPFSFKHFLKRDPGSGHHHGTGARPKVFGNHHSNNESFGRLDAVPTDSDPGLRLPRHVGAPEFSSVLPDFVQDHLVVEQCYLNHSDSGVNLENLENLPDFAINGSPDKSRSRVWNERGSAVSEVGGDNTPSFLQSPTKSHRPPFDPTADTTKSLPDFLADGPIHGGRLGDATQPCDVGDTSPPPEGEGRELEATRRRLADKTRRVQALEKELLAIRSRDHEEMATLEKAIEQVEDNLKRSTRRAVTAESAVSKLKQEMKLLSKEVAELRQENCALRFCQGGAGSVITPDGRQTQRLAQDLRVAALTAEQSLRSLLTGVGNLRTIASTLENLDHARDQTGDRLRDADDESGATL